MPARARTCPHVPWRAAGRPVVVGRNMDSEAADRFVRAAARPVRPGRVLPGPTASGRQPGAAYAVLLSVTRNAARPLGTPDPARPNFAATIRRTLADPTNGVYAFESSYSPDIVRTRLARVDVGRAARLDVTREGIAGDVTDRYEAAEPFSFASA
ncbi:hypothetical protein AB0M64_20800 [Streptomyces sp. NPDC051771]|uniref:hypothetical protein n=1 Tax=Streptomyces sp. NPDC051771 TaxID=3154847 RepID=UPI00342D8587